MNSWQLIQEFMKKRCYNQAQMAAHVGMNPQQISNAKSGRFKLSLETKLELAKELGHSEHETYLWDRKERAKNKLECRIIDEILEKLNGLTETERQAIRELLAKIT